MTMPRMRKARGIYEANADRYFMVSIGRCVFLPNHYNTVLDYTVTQYARSSIERATV